MSNLEQQNAVSPEPGWYDDGHGQTRWWNGLVWTGAVSSMPPQSPLTPAPAPMVVVNASPVVGQRKMYKTSHGFHLIMSLVTLGAWIPVWIIVGIVNASRA